MLEYNLDRPEKSQHVVIKDFGQGQGMKPVLLVPNFSFEDVRMEQRGSNFVFHFEDGPRLSCLFF